jgi:acyl transferase domain-containing protein
MGVQGSIFMTEQMPNHAIAIIGMAGRFPRARNLEEFWHIVSNGVEVLDTASDSEMDAAGVGADRRSDPNFVPKYTTLAEADYFDAGFFGMSPREAQILDPQQRIFLECAWEALENAGYSSNSLEQSVGVYAGASMNTYIFSQLLRNPAFVAAVGGYQLMLGNDKDFLCTHASYELNLRGPSLTIQTACSTSLVAVAVACQALQAGECDMALAGGVSVTFPQRSGYMYEEGMILSPDGHCRPFDIDAHGTRGGAGAGIVVLKRLSDALADRDTIHAVIRGVAINNDGAGKAGYTAPSIDGQAEVVATAQALADIAPRTISYIEAHGTGTHLGDPIEIAALTKVFRASTADVGFCRLGSLKANIGHLDAAAGIAGLIKTVLALKHREFPPLVNFRTANPQIDLDRSPFVASAKPSSWHSDGTPRRAGVSSFGIGGTNAHVVVEEAPPPVPASSSNGGGQLLVVSAKSAAALDKATTQLADFLDQNQGQSLANVAWTLQAGRQAFTHRRAIVAKNETQAIELLRAPGIAAQHEGGVRPVAFLFSGQGSQYAGMGAGLYEAHPVFRDAIDRCAQVLEPLLKLDIRKQILSERNDPLINETRFAQPALFTMEYALASLWRSWGVSPQAMLGHSIGEYAAAHLAGVMSLEDALSIVAARGQLMQDLPAGSMAAVHGPAEELRKLACEGIEIAAINAPGLCTVSGPAAAVAELLKRLKEKEIEFRPLHTSHAFHSAMMEPVLEPFAKIVKHIELRPPQIPYISNVTGTWITAEQATSPDYYATHLRCPVQFETGVRTIVTEPGMLLLEVGPGSALTSLARLTVDRQKGKHVVSSLSHPQERRPDDESILEAAGRLWTAGVDLDWPKLHLETAVGRVPLPTYPFERKRCWVEATPAAGTSTGSGAVSFSENVGDWLFAPTWTRQPTRTGAKSKVAGLWLLLGQRGELGRALEQRLQAAGANVVLVENGERFEAIEPRHFQARWDQVQDLSAIVERVSQVDGPVAGAVFLGTGAHDRADGRFAYNVLVALAEALPANGRPVRAIVARFGTESVFHETVVDPEAALALGPVLVLPTEVPHLQMRAVDLETPDGAASVDAAAAAIFEEICDDGLENIVAWRGTCRWMRRFERILTAAPDTSELPFRMGGVYLITGGLGGLGLTLAHWLAAKASARLVLTARTPLPAREQWDRWITEKGPNDPTVAIIKKIKEIEESGGEVMAMVADAGDLGQMKQVVETVRDRFGALDGVIHAAGVPGTGRISFLM